jgi:putative solute:sodium symporter small subunit
MTAPPHTSAGDGGAASSSERAQRYWRANLRYLGILLGIWFAVSYGAGILFAERLNAMRIPGTGFPLGFWFAQQGSIYAFVVLIFVYVVLMNRLDRRYGYSEDDER